MFGYDGEIAIIAETSMSEPPAPQNNAITRNRTSRVLSFPRNAEPRNHYNFNELKGKMDCQQAHS
jgi:hypothetical protein